MPPSKILQGRCAKRGASFLHFTGETSFSSRFFFNISEISANIKKPSKYKSRFWHAQQSHFVKNLNDPLQKMFYVYVFIGFTAIK